MRDALGWMQRAERKTALCEMKSLRIQGGGDIAMRKILVVVLAVVMAVCFAGCGGGQPTVTDKDNNTVAVGTIEELEEIVNNDVVETESSLRAEYDKLVAEIDTYDKYIKNKSKVEAFYGTVHEETKAICIRMREYSIAYTEIVMKSGGTNDEKYDAMDDLYDLIYDDLLGDVYDAFYDGVVSDGYDYTGYEQWSDAMSEAYDMWSDSLSDVYDEWSDALSDIYDFWSDVCSCIYDGSTEDVKEEITKFEEEIAEMKSSKE